MNGKTTYAEFMAKPQHARLLRQEELLLEVTELITDLMDRGGITRAELANRLGRSKAFITQLLRGGHNMTLRTLGDIAWALDCDLRLNAVPKGAWTGFRVEGVRQFAAPSPLPVQYAIRTKTRPIPTTAAPSALSQPFTEVAA